MTNNGILAYLCIFMDERLFFFLSFLLLKLQQRWPDDPIITSKAALTCSLCYQPSERGKWWDARQDKQRHFSHLVVQEQYRKRWRRDKGQKTTIRRRKCGWSRSWCSFHSIFLSRSHSHLFHHSRLIPAWSPSWLLRQKSQSYRKSICLFCQPLASEREIKLKLKLKNSSLMFIK